MKATIGQDFTFNWSLILEKNDSLVYMSLEYSKTEQFTETSTEKIAIILQDSLHIVNAFKGKVSVSRTGSLTLHNVSVEQRGFYKCSVSLQQKTRAVSIKRQLLVGGNYARIVVTSLKSIFYLVTLFARTSKKVGTVPTCSRRIFSPANFNQSRCRILVFASRRANKDAK